MSEALRPVDARMETRYVGTGALSRAPLPDEPIPLSALPPTRLTSVERESPARWSRLSGYRVEGDEVVFAFPPMDYPGHDEDADPVRVAGPFNNWSPGADWTLHTGSDAPELRMPLARVCALARIPVEFKFVSASGYWFQPHDRSPNRVIDGRGCVNLLLDPARTGDHVLRFHLEQPITPGVAPTLLWGGAGETIPIAAPPGGAFLDLWSALPLGVTVDDDSTTFRLFAPRASGVTIETAGPGGDGRTRSALAPKADGIWEIVFPGNLHGRHYRYFVHGTNRDASTAFDPREPVLDPYATASVAPGGPGIVVDARRISHPEKPYTPPKVTDLVIAEAHLLDLLGLDPEFSRHPRPGFRELAAFIRKPDCPLRTLGVNAIELLPVQESEAPPVETVPPGFHWGYMPVNWFAPGSHFAKDPARGSQVEDFRDLVAACHEAGLAVILDVVYNHTGAPNALMRIDKHHFFTDGADGALSNWSGCGNDYRADTPMGLRLVIDSLKQWVNLYDVDGFRFDLAELVGLPALIEVRQALSPLKENLILIAEPWSFRGHLGGALRGQGYASWNDGYRDFLARHVRGDGDADSLAHHLTAEGATRPGETLNYTESHDDRCWLDRITENAANDGTTPTKNDIARTRLMFACLFASQGVPMLAAGQEFLRTKGGANNTYIRGDLSRLTPERLHAHADTREFVRGWIALRRSELGRSLRFSEKPPADFFRKFPARDGRGLALLINARRTPDAGAALLFAANPTPEFADIPCDLADLSQFRLFADERAAGTKPLHERRDGPHKIPGGVRLPPYSAALWAMA